MIPTVSVCIPTYNGAAFVGDALRSVLAQTFTDLEVVVVDDASTDSTMEVVASVDDPRVRIHRNADRLRIPGNWNRGVALARAPYVCVFHQDDVMLPDNLEKKVRMLQDAPRMLFVHSAVEVIVDRSAPRVPAEWMEQSKNDFVADGLHCLPRLILEGNRICAPSVVTRRQALVERGGFKETLGFACDYEMWMRLCLDGEVGFLSRPLVRYRWHGENASHTYSFELGAEDVTRAALPIITEFAARAGRAEEAEILRGAVRSIGKLRWWAASLNRERERLERERADWQRVAEEHAGWQRVAEERAGWQQVAEEREQSIHKLEDEQRAALAKLTAEKRLAERRWATLHDSRWMRVGRRIGVAPSIVPDTTRTSETPTADPVDEPLSQAPATRSDPMAATPAAADTLDRADLPGRLASGPGLAGLSAILSSIPVALLLLQLTTLHVIPNDDYWTHFAARTLGAPGILPWFSALFERSNAHLVVVPNLLYHMNFLLTGGDNRGLYLLDLLLLGALLFVLVRILRLGGGLERWQYALLVTLAAWMLFSPAAAHTLIVSQSGVAWFSASLFVALSLLGVVRSLRDGSRLAPVLVLGATLLALLSYSTALFVLPGVLLFLLVDRYRYGSRTRLLWAYLGLAMLWSLFWALTSSPEYAKRDLRPEEALTSAIAFFGEIAAGVGLNTTADAKATAWSYGLAGATALAAILLSQVRLWMDSRNRSLFVRLGPWLVLCLYGALNGLASAATRGVQDFEPTLTSGYATLAALFWISALIYFVILAQARLPIGVGRAVVVGLLVVFAAGVCVPAFLNGLDRLAFYAELFSRDTDLVVLAAQVEALPPDLAKRIVLGESRSATFRKLVSTLKARRHVPYATPLIPEYAYGRPLHDRPDPPPAAGRAPEARGKGWGVVEVSGKLDDGLAPEDVAHLLVTNRVGSLRGGAILRDHPSEAVGLFGRSRPSSRLWIGYARPQRGDDVLVVYARLVEGGLAWVGEVSVPDDLDFDPEGIRR